MLKFIQLFFCSIIILTINGQTPELDKLWESGNYIAYYKSVDQNNVKTSNGFYRLSIASNAASRKNLALKFAEKAFELDTANYKIQRYLYDLLIADKLYNRGAALLNRMILENPEVEILLKYKAELFESIKQKDSAHYYYQMLWEKDSLNALYNYKIASFLLDTGNVNEAMEYFHKSLQGDSTFVKSTLKLANIYDNTDETDTAIALLLDTYRYDSTQVAVNYKLGNIYFSLREYKKTIYSYEKVLVEGDSLFILLRQLAIAYIMKRNPKKAIDLLNAAIKQRPEDPTCYFYLGNAYKHFDPDKSINSYKKAIDLYYNPAQLSMYYNAMAQTQKMAKLYDESLSSYNKAYSLNKRGETLYEISYLYEAYIRDTTSAIKHYNRYFNETHERDKHFGLYRVGYLYYEQEKFDRAKNYFEKYIEEANPEKDGEVIESANKYIEKINEELHFIDSK